MKPGKRKLTARAPSRYLDAEVHHDQSLTLSGVNYLGERYFFHIHPEAVDELRGILDDTGEVPFATQGSGAPTPPTP